MVNPAQTSATTEIPPSRRVAKRLAFVLDDVRPKTVGDVVLAYHRVGARTPSPVDMSASMFERQMAHLRAAHDVMTLDELDAYHRFGKHSKQFGVVVTFDDGTADFVDVALPILARYAIPVTLYLATGPVDSQRNFPANGVPVSWSALRDALSTGLVTIGAHTHTHRMLDRCSLAEATAEIDTCIARIEDELGVTPTHFAYPKAVASDERGRGVDALVRDRFDTAAIAGTRTNVRGATDRWRLHRSPIQNADLWEGFRRKVDGGMQTEDDVRRVINLVRYRGKTA